MLLFAIFMLIIDLNAALSRHTEMSEALQKSKTDMEASLTQRVQQSEEARTLQVAALTEELAAAKSRAQAEVEALRADMASVTSANSKLQVGFLFLVIYSFYYFQNLLSIIAKQDLVSDLKRQVAAEQSQTQVRNHFYRIISALFHCIYDTIGWFLFC